MFFIVFAVPLSLPRTRTTSAHSQRPHIKQALGRGALIWVGGAGYFLSVAFDRNHCQYAGGCCPPARLPACPPASHQVDVVPFIAAVREMWAGERVGAWLGHLSLATELYDHCEGEVRFAALPTVQAMIVNPGAVVNPTVQAVPISRPSRQKPPREEDRGGG
eukprot:SAG25_NODE_244_length_11127_cov_82.802956_3_plen_162_part_00